MKKLGALLAIVPLSIGLAACGSGGSDDETVTIGVVSPDPANEKLREEAEKQGITVEFTEFSDYNQPNPALSQGQTDLNWFQHIAYLADYNVNSDDDLQIVGPTVIYPLGLYSEKHDSVDQIPEGGEIAIPNDAVNETRAILVLQSAGLVQLTEDKAQPTLDDVDTEASKVRLTPVDAAQTVVSLPSVDGSIVNNDFIADAGLNPDDALFEDDASQQAALPYVNLFVSRAGDEDNETYQKIVEIYHSEPVQDAVAEDTQGTAVTVDVDVQELRDTQTRLEDELRNNS
ncbi:MetQ/NlpA family ABC transporter substrate-binding protein [Rothia sp. AR01]|uniref:MetQ/NlpA family ABC transporter substrate-binding protein n=1 Tax=Rothia santali TaxID=2949643 RepID=A0A9X2HDW0_9MICC|nr:MetQ/NlpA family ABC transporter substrate-binding protein [Rothia santali]MCP3425419.1 MetQ/NlpA family ABC transporter substrate-binding protein [Rothia santali]